MGTFSIWHWVIVLVVVVLIFGTGKLRNMGKDLGGAIKDFKKGMNEGEADADAKPAINQENTVDQQQTATKQETQR